MRRNSRMQLKNVVLPLLLALILGSVSAAQTLSRGHQTLVYRGLQLNAVVFETRAGNFNLARWNESNFTTINFGGDQTYPAALLPPAPGIPWSNIGWYLPDIPQNAYPYASQLIRIQLSDEQDITDPTHLNNIQYNIAGLHDRYPNLIVHTNQWGAQHTAAQLRYYMQYCQPDMLMFDTYPFDGDLAGGSPTSFYRDMEKYRKLGLEGNDGTGNQPIPVGIYTQTWKVGGHVPSESEIRLNNFSAWAFGYKLVDSFIYDTIADGIVGVAPIMFSGYGTANPTAQFYQVAETNRQSLILGPALTRLISTDLRMKMGRHEEPVWWWTEEVDNDLPSGVSSWTAGADPYITSITAANLGTKNNGLPGDVIVGYFKPLAAEFTNAGHEDDVYFMLVNGLSDENGSVAETTQKIRLTFDFGASDIDSLLYIDRDVDKVLEVSLVHDGGSLYHLDWYLGGGTGDLFKFNNGGTFVPEPATITLLGIALFFGFCRCWLHLLKKRP